MFIKKIYIDDNIKDIIINYYTRIIIIIILNICTTSSQWKFYIHTHLYIILYLLYKIFIYNLISKN
jgi:hypothetical protein